MLDARTTITVLAEDPLLALRGSGKDLWVDEHADAYVRRLREDWERAEPSGTPIFWELHL